MMILIMIFIKQNITIYKKEERRRPINLKHHQSLQNITEILN